MRKWTEGVKFTFCFHSHADRGPIQEERSKDGGRGVCGSGKEVDDVHEEAFLLAVDDVDGQYD